MPLLTQRQTFLLSSIFLVNIYLPLTANFDIKFAMTFSFEITSRFVHSRSRVDLDSQKRSEA